MQVMDFTDRINKRSIQKFDLEFGSRCPGGYAEKAEMSLLQGKGEIKTGGGSSILM